MIMTDNTQTATPDAALKQLDILVGTWTLSEETSGQIRFEWMEGGFFLLQHIDILHGENKIKGMEVIGRERVFESTEPSEDIKSRYYGHDGSTLDYVYEIEGNVITIWGGAKGSPAYYKGTFSDDGNIMKGAWQWPGGGYSSTATRVVSK
jgi:hypothetical protein